ncbi:MAG TPA: nucleotide sugar dehydrogenase, partial [Candidatus Acidoferrum sp.]|nr:nucleotide sugar dehydrogenase [Candidatus Acidoferrum sp.]
KSYIPDVPDADLAAQVSAKRLRATTDMKQLGAMDAIDICVPTPLRKTKDPDLSYVVKAVEAVAATLGAGQLVILESTTYPGTTDEVVQPMLEAKGLKADVDFLLAFSPERVDPGNTMPLRSIPKVIGGCSTGSALAAHEFYAGLVDVVHPVSNARAAETVKLLENTFRLVNIGLINEFAVLCNHLGIDSTEVIAAAATKPFGFLPFFPGPGAGGHCIPLDPLYLNWKAKQQGVVSRFIELADDINTKMPAYVVDLVARALNDDSKSVRDARILIVGVAYKNNVADTRQSPAIAIIDRLRYQGAIVNYHDPLIPLLDFDLDGWPEWRPRLKIATERRSLHVVAQSFPPRRRRYDMLHSVALDAGMLAAADCVLILSKHDDVDYCAIGQQARVVIDTRDALSLDMRTNARARIIHL